MREINQVLKSESFPDMDARIAWALTIVCLVIGLLLTLGVLTVQVGALPGWAWIAIVVAQIITACAVAGAARLSSRKEAESTSSDGPRA